MSNISPEFWNRIGLRYEDKETCIRAVRDRYREHKIEEFGEQGYCSFTLLITPLETHSIGNGYAGREIRVAGSAGKEPFLVQLRPVPHALDLNVVRAASTTYPSLAPVIRAPELVLPGKLCAYEIERLHGTPFARLQPRNCILDAATCEKLERLVASFAGLIAQGWRAESRTQIQSTPRNTRADSPMDVDPDMLSQCKGKVGSSIVQRLQKLAAELPDTYLRERAKTVLKSIRHMADYPVVLNHGDLIPSNILVDEETWEITGLVDWAEAEILPFGTCLYGLEHLLGYLDIASMSPSDAYSGSDDAPTFVFFDYAPRLRRLFWSRLLAAIPGLEDRKEEVKVIRDMGVLLWRGIAWDDGAINRVVNEVDDAEELACLRAFLDASLDEA